ncbi:hypothetical protein [Bifidobacterium scaligerum]|uniref:Uncharacterized protein n=1 Tax=Bifidobacterium scaligerum TaxID=2052656 RepID=A0A2M9HT88_9BIFI|nr:hypothetical protein [Bifidobacterium scaligerum]PJM80009.1 hypothetical protein CUU80_02420 [Bifidobacterium scaligerum]
MSTINDLAKALRESIPGQPSFARYDGIEPPANAKPPWIITSVTGRGLEESEPHRLTAMQSKLTARIVGLTEDQVNFAAHVMLMGIMTAECDGFVIGAPVFYSDSGAYAAGMTSSDTARRYPVRVIEWHVTWSWK